MGNVWSRKDEQLYNELRLRKQAFEQEGRAAVEAVVEKIHTHNISRDNLVDELIKHADGVRDALSRYDSGVRVAK